jgi:hypothetical protein
MSFNLRNWALAVLVPGDLTLGSGKLSREYHNNGYFLFPEKSRIKLKSPRYAGYGVRPEGKIIGYTNGGDIVGDQYIIEMETDKNGDYLKWFKIRRIEGSPERVTEIQKHFKWNIEHHFKKIKSPTNANC